jgi:hypothetical protein
MSITAATILDRAAELLLDTAHRTWPEDELLSLLNEALSATALVKHDFYTVQDFVTLAAGVLQTIPDDGVALLDIVRNETDGRVITQVDKSLLEEANRFWPAATQQAEVEHYTADPRNPLRFQVFPPNDGTGSVEMLYGATPPQVMYAAEEIPVPASYQAPLLDFVLARAYLKNSKRQDLAKAANFAQSWARYVGATSQAQLALSPKVASSPGVTT